ncbi:MAG TPA: CHAT domain-containing protein [Thermoanaerobaculia bacterium]|nr:CHAT domain-containing protein [Thermoanaerobaculia bacterium]
MGPPAGRRALARFRFGLLPFVLVFSTAAAVRPSPWEAEYRKAREANLREGSRAAAAIVEAAVVRAGTSNEDWVYALRIYRAELQALMKNPGDALPVLQTPLPPHLRKTEIEIRRLTALAMATHFSNNAAEALRLADDAVALATKDVPALAADAYYLRGNLRTNEDDIRRAMRLFKAAGNDTWVLMSEALLVRSFELQQRYSEAVEIGERLVPRMMKARLTNAGTIAGNVGSSYYWLGDYESAKEYFRLAEQSARKLNTSYNLALWLDRLGDVHLATGDLDGAAKWYGEAATFAREHEHRQLARTLSNLAQVAIRRGQFAEARRSIEESIRLDTAVKELEDVQRARVIRASLNMAMRDYSAAEKELEDVVARTTTPVWRLQAETGLGRLYAAQKRSDLAERYFALAVKTAVEDRAEIEPNHRFSYFNSVEDLFDTYVDFLVENKQIVKALEITEESRARTLTEGLGAAASKKKLDAPAIAKRANATILAYWLGTRRSYVWTVTAAGVAIHELPPAAVIERDVDQYQKVLQHGSLTDSAPRGQRLFQTLLAPAVRGVAQGSKVIIIADGNLHTMNFETLVVPGSRPHWWIDDAIVTSANSLHLLGRSTAKRGAESALLLVGNTPRADPAFGPLPNAAGEMEKVGAHFPRKKVLSGAAATPKAFLRAAPATFDVIHFVAHGIATRRRPLDSAVILAKDDADRYKLFARDIVDQNLTARLVTISSCHGAGTRAYAGEGLVGLAWAFLRAGAEQVIAALWEVDDAATMKLMDHMYARIRAGRDPAVALRDAKRALIHSRTSHQKPRYWAPFVIYAGS